MPELPDVELYLAALRPRVVGSTIERVRVRSPFFVRSFDPPVEALAGHRVIALSRMGKRLVWQFDGDLWAVVHLMIGGRLQWKRRGTAVPGRVGLAAFDFPDATLLFTEAGTQKRASLHVIRGEAGVRALDLGGIDVLTCTFDEFAGRLVAENHTLKRALTDPGAFSGIGNAYSDEILFAARLSPTALTRSLDQEEMRRLFEATRGVLTAWTRRLIDETGDVFPAHVTAFRDGMAVHGRYRQPCPRCGAPVQRIVYATNEANYCAACQTGGRILADRALSRLLKGQWPPRLDEE